MLAFGQQSDRSLLGHAGLLCMGSAVHKVVESNRQARRGPSLHLQPIKADRDEAAPGGLLLPVSDY